MKIIAGRLRAHPLVAPSSRLVRPMSEKLRGALFNVLGDIYGLSVLDAYAGTGAVGLEAISRGAKFVEAVERLPQAIKAIQANVKNLGVEDQYNLITADVAGWLKWPDQVKLPERYDIILVDPPYAKVEEGILNALAVLLKKEGLLVVSHSSKMESAQIRGASLIQRRDYGDSSLSFYGKANL